MDQLQYQLYLQSQAGAMPSSSNLPRPSLAPLNPFPPFQQPPFFQQQQYFQQQPHFQQQQFAHQLASSASTAPSIPNILATQPSTSTEEEAVVTNHQPIRFSRPEAVVTNHQPSTVEEAVVTNHQPISFSRPEALSWPEATSLLLDNSTPTVIKMPHKADSNTLWKFRKTGQEDFLDQGYRWVEPGGVKRLKNGLTKRVFYIRSKTHKRGDLKFQMIVWQHEEQRPGDAIVHIMGDSSIAEDFPHGNSKSNNARAHTRTNKGSMKEMAESSEKASACYRRMRSNTPSDMSSQVRVASI